MTVALDLSKYIDLYLSEGREHVTELTAALAALENDPTDRDAVASAFRAVHSVKGMAAAMGYTETRDIAHALESILESVRAGDTILDAGLRLRLLEQCDLLGAAVDGARPAPMTPSSAGATSRATHVRVRAARLDALMNLSGELEISRVALERDVKRICDAGLDETFSAMTRLLGELRAQVLSARMVPVSDVFNRFPRLVRETARELAKDVDFTLDGDIEVDRSLLDRIGDPVMHLLRNALDHGIESPEQRRQRGKPPSGRLTLSAQREAEFVLLRVADDGGGVDRDAVLRRAVGMGIAAPSANALDDAELLRLLVHPGFSTATSVSKVSGRGVGLDVVATTVRALGGAMELRSLSGRGTAITLRLPASVAIVRALIARVGEASYAIPFTHVLETLSESELEAHAGEAKVVRLRGEFGAAGTPAPRAHAVSVLVRGQRAALVVDELVGQQDIVVKRFDPPVRGASLFSGATVLGDGSTALIIDVGNLF